MVKMGKEKKTIKRRTSKNKKNTIMRKRKIKGGDCGCKNSLFAGGNVNPASFDGSLPIKYYYPQNNFTNDRSDPAFVESARNLPNNYSRGGKKSRKSRKIKGGDMLMGSVYNNNPLMTFGTIDGARNSVDILYGNASTNPSVFDQPILKGFSNSNPPLA